MSDRSYGELFDEFTNKKSHEDLAKAYISLMSKRSKEINNLLNMIDSEISELDRALGKFPIDIVNEKIILKSRLQELREAISNIEHDE